MKRAAWPILSGTVVIALAVVCYLLTIPTTHVDNGRLARLVVTSTGLPALKAKPSGAVVTAANDPFSVARTAARNHPHSTGGYSATWTGSKSSAVGASLVVEQLPTSALARSAASEAGALYLKKTAFTSESLALKSRFTVPSIPGSAGAIFAKPASKSTQAVVAEVVVFHFGRAAVLESLLQTVAAKNGAESLAIREERQLVAVEPTLSLAVTTRPVVASSIFGVVTAVLAASVGFGPGAVREARSRRQARRVERERQQYRVRGHKTLRRHASPAPPGFARPRRRGPWSSRR